MQLACCSLVIPSHLLLQTSSAILDFLPLPGRRVIVPLLENFSKNLATPLRLTVIPSEPKRSLIAGGRQP